MNSKFQWTKTNLNKWLLKNISREPNQSNLISLKWCTECRVYTVSRWSGWSTRMLNIFFNLLQQPGFARHCVCQTRWFTYQFNGSLLCCYLPLSCSSIAADGVTESLFIRYFVVFFCHSFISIDNENVSIWIDGYNVQQQNSAQWQWMPSKKICC